MIFTLEELKLLIELLVVEQNKQAVKHNNDLIIKYENIKSKLNMIAGQHT